MPSEHGFILVHVAMVRHTGELVDAVIKALEAASKKDRAGFNKNVAAMVAVMQKINSVMEVCVFVFLMTCTCVGNVGEITTRRLWKVSRLYHGHQGPNRYGRYRPLAHSFL